MFLGGGCLLLCRNYTAWSLDKRSGGGGRGEGMRVNDRQRNQARRIERKKIFTETGLLVGGVFARAREGGRYGEGEACFFFLSSFFFFLFLFLTSYFSV